MYILAPFFTEPHRSGPSRAARDHLSFMQQMLAQGEELGLQPGQASIAPIQIRENEKELRVRMRIPGFDPQNVKVEISRNRLTISGSQEYEHNSEEEESEAGEVTYSEFGSGSFTRTIPFSGPMDTERAEARFSDHTLQVTVPKQKGSSDESKRLEIASR